MTEINERKIALDIYADIKKGKPSQTALQNIESYVTKIKRDQSSDEKKSGISKQSRSFITRLVYGTLENYIYIDFIISEFTEKPVSKLKNFIVNVLEISVYQLLFMENIPDHAVVDEAVSLVRKSPKRALSGFVNALLRNVARSKDKLPKISGSKLNRLSLRYSVPEHIIMTISDALDLFDSKDSGFCDSILKDSESDNVSQNLAGRLASKASVIGTKSINQNTEAVLRGLRTKRPLTIRCNTSIITAQKLKEMLEQEGVSVHENTRLPDYAMSISGYDSIPALQTFKDGLFYVQDIGSILSGEASGFIPGEKVLDLCGAPGGKAIGAALAGAFVETGDISHSKTALIEENVLRLKLKNINVNVRDAAAFYPELLGGFDAVICDVPCSGIGIIGRKPDICRNLKWEGMEELIVLQRSIIKNAVNYVKPGGRLIYSTCTINPKENFENSRYIETLGLISLYEKQQFPGIDGDTDGFYTNILRKSE